MQSRANDIQNSTMDPQSTTQKLEFAVLDNSARAEVLECLVEGLQFLRGETPAAAQQLAKRVLANIIIEHLEASGFTVNRKTPAHRLLDDTGTATPAADKFEDTTLIRK